MKALPSIVNGVRVIKDCGMDLVKPTSAKATRVAVVECIDCKAHRRVDYNSFKRMGNGRCYKCANTGENSNNSTNGESLIQLNKREYNIWGLMKQRCFNPKCKDYCNYGGRGITVCDEWLDFPAFLEWSNGRLYVDGTLERTNVFKGYNPANVVVLPNKFQAFTRRDSMGIVTAVAFAKAYKEFGKPQGYLKFYSDMFGLTPSKVRHFITVSPHKEELAKLEL